MLRKRHLQERAEEFREIWLLKSAFELWNQGVAVVKIEGERLIAKQLALADAHYSRRIKEYS